MPELYFKGKEFVYNHHLTVPYRPLETHPDKSVGEDSGNLIIHGDNLHALKALLPHYAGKVDCIFIDPPYNTGNENWCYNDNVNSPIMREWLSSNPINREDMLRHDKWACLMYPRLKLLHELLSEQGSFWMTLDDNEIHHARLILDDIFGADSFIASIVWQKRTSPESRLQLGSAHDYILVYGKDPCCTKLKKLALSEGQISQFTNPDDDARGEWVSTDLTAQGFRPNQMYPITTSGGTMYSPPPGRCWALIEPEFNRLREEGRIWFGASGAARPRIKTYLKESEGVSAWTWWPNNEVGDNQESKKEINKILGSDGGFDYPKPTRLLERIIQLATDTDSIVLDSFAGSGTTAHAVLALNAKDGGNRNFILVECEEYADTLTAERVRRVINGYEFEGTQKEELFRKKVNFSTLKDAPKLLREIEHLEQVKGKRFDKISKTIKNDELLVIGEKKITERTEGLGGGFTYCTLGQPLDLDKLLTGEHLPEFQSIGAWLFHTATGMALPNGVGAYCNTPLRGNAPVGNAIIAEWYLGESPSYHVWLIYRPDLDWLKSRDAALTLTLAEKIAATFVGANGDSPNKRHLVFAPARFVASKHLLPLGVEHAPLPFALYRFEKD
ncbi:MAG TPA: site-specific DNA-methyltransferase [Desulfuromonadales bacterium]|nr:site-specific DNA-methyltransferase [Desulfuromonadales bacterium]